jgi:hypothetical protein
MGRLPYSNRYFNKPKSTLSDKPDFKSGSYMLIEIHSIIYLVETIVVTEECLKLKFLENFPSGIGVVNKQLWIKLSEFKLIEILTIEKVREIKIDLIS